MTDHFELTSTREAAAANDIKDILDHSGSIGRKALNAAMVAAFGATNAS